jgi:hypothetical protein
MGSTTFDDVDRRSLLVGVCGREVRVKSARRRHQNSPVLARPSSGRAILSKRVFAGQRPPAHLQEVRYGFSPVVVTHDLAALISVGGGFTDAPLSEANLGGA